MTTILNTAEDLRRAVHFAASLGMPQLPVVTWGAQGRGAAIWVSDATARWPKKLIARAGKRPILVVIGADLGEDRDPDPDQWRCMPELKRWTRAAMIHAAGGEADHYRSACSMAEQVGRCTIIECTPRTAHRWAELLACPRSVLIWPRDGLHPASPSREAVQ